MFLTFEFDFEAFAANGGTQADLDAFAARIASRTWFNLDAPDPGFPEHTVDPSDQLPGRPMDGKLETATIFECLKLLVIDDQVRGRACGYEIFSHLEETVALVLGPNLGQLLYENQHLIPVEFRDKMLFFWGKIYCDPESDRYVRYLYWDGRWHWGSRWIDRDDWEASYCAVVLAKKL